MEQQVRSRSPKEVSRVFLPLPLSTRADLTCASISPEIVRQFFGVSDTPLSSVPSTLNNPLINVTSSTPSPRRRQSALTLQTFPTSPTRSRTSSRPTYPPDQPLSPTQRIRLLSQQLFRPGGGAGPTTDENATEGLKPKASSGSLRGLFVRKMGSIPALRGMQSFESGGSGDTARPEGSSGRDSSRTATRPVREDPHERMSSEEVDPQAIPRLQENVVLLGPVPIPTKDHLSKEVASKPSPATVLPPPVAFAPLEDQTFSPRIFDVIQEYRGDLMVELEREAPGDDPRFVVWKTTIVPIVPLTQPASKRASAVPSSSSASSAASPVALVPGHTFPTPSSSSSLVKTSRTLQAASIERWVAQITFQFNLEVWLDFFLVYRTYISPLSLCRLLMVRFEWACRPEEGDGEDIRDAKQLVTSRTFYVLRVWLTGFFEVDWLHGRQMRTEFTSWLNRLRVEKEFDQLTKVSL